MRTILLRDAAKKSITIERSQQYDFVCTLRSHHLPSFTARLDDLNTIRFERSVYAFYDVEQLLDEARDKGKDYITIYEFLKHFNPGIIKKYGDVEQFVNGKLDRTWNDESINAVKYIIFCKGVGVHDMLQDKNFEMGYTSMLDNYKYNDRDWTVGKEQSYIARVEKGEADIQLSSFFRIARALGIEFTPTFI